MSEYSFNSYADFGLFLKSIRSSDEALITRNSNLAMYETTYRKSLGGCKCSKVKRINFAKEQYEEVARILQKRDENSVKVLMKILQVEVLNFRRSTSEDPFVTISRTT